MRNRTDLVTAASVLMCEAESGVKRLGQLTLEQVSQLHRRLDETIDELNQLFGDVPGLSRLKVLRLRFKERMEELEQAAKCELNSEALQAA